MPRYKEPSQKQLDFVRWYTSPASPTYDNALQSAISAGFSESYAKSHASRRLVPLAKQMIKTKYSKQADRKADKAVEKAAFYRDLLDKAEKNIEKDLSIPDDADIKERHLKQKSTHFTAERLGKEQWSTKTITENHGLFTLNSESLEQLANTLNTAIEAQKPIKAEYTVHKLEQKDTEQGKKDS